MIATSAPTTATDPISARSASSVRDRAWAAAASVTDPEIPVLTIADLGILREVTVGPGVPAAPDGSVTTRGAAAESRNPLGIDGEPAVEVVITPTYSGCPAMDTIRADLEQALHAAGFAQVNVRTVHSPAWTTEWMSNEGRRKLAEFGIAPPTRGVPSGPVTLTLGRRDSDAISCPRCGAPGRERNRFGSTSCKALYICTSCSEPFDYFKAI